MLSSKDYDNLSEKSSQVAELLKGMSHEIRLLTLCYISDEEKSVQSIQEFTKTSQSNASQHLAKLRALGILQTRKESNIVYYSIKDQKVKELISQLNRIFC